MQPYLSGFFGKPRPGITTGGRPRTLQELVLAALCTGWDQAFRDYLEQFVAQPSFEALVDPPEALSGYRRELMAAVVETLAEHEGWPVPSWAQDRRQTVTATWPQDRRQTQSLATFERLQRLFGAAERMERIEVLRQGTPVAFLRRGLVLDPRLLQPLKDRLAH